MILSDKTRNYIFYLDQINNLRINKKLECFSEEEQSIFPMFLVIGEQAHLTNQDAFEKFKTASEHFEDLTNRLNQQGILEEYSQGFRLTNLGIEKLRTLESYM